MKTILVDAVDGLIIKNEDNFKFYQGVNKCSFMCYNVDVTFCCTFY